MPRRLIGHRTALGVADSTGVNPYLPGTGWDVIFGPDVIASSLTELEVYHIAIDGPVGSSVAVLVDNAPWDFVSQGWSNGWDPSQPMLLGQGSTVALCWNVAATAPPYNKTTNIQAVATLWLRHEETAQRVLPGLAG